MNLPEIKKIAQAEMENKRSSPYNERGDKYAHGERAAALAVRLRKLIFPNDSGYDDILTVAAWFHDISNGVDDHWTIGAAQARELLTGHCTVDELEKICGIIAVHDDRRPGDSNYSNAIKIHQDADWLDHFGTLYIWRFTAYAIGHDETINDALDYYQTKWPEDAARWHDELHFDLSKRIFDDKTAFVETFIERFAAELAGGIWNEEILVG
ncbi:MAG: hypothetical protein FWC90_03385 [Oscillospiraceae bacterium]|nr:hypothetical protein [Oscillospiraceae bacterium]